MNRIRKNRHEIYYYVDEEFDVRACAEAGDLLDGARFSTGNYFGTREEAEEFAKALILFAKAWHERNGIEKEEENKWRQQSR